MAVPKKRKSKSKTNSRKHVWKRQASKEAAKAISLAKSILSDSPSSFVYFPPEDEPQMEASPEVDEGQTDEEGA